MSEPTYWIGQSIELRAAFTGPGLAPVEATGVAFAVRRPDGTVEVINGEQGANAGLWLGYVTADQAGVWKVRATCAGPRAAVDEGEFRVTPSAVV